MRIDGRVMAAATCMGSIPPGHNAGKPRCHTQGGTTASRTGNFAVTSVIGSRHTSSIRRLGRKSEADKRVLIILTVVPEGESNSQHGRPVSPFRKHSMTLPEI